MGFVTFLPSNFTLAIIDEKIDVALLLFLDDFNLLVHLNLVENVIFLHQLGPGKLRSESHAFSFAFFLKYIQKILEIFKNHAVIWIAIFEFF